MKSYYQWNNVNAMTHADYLMDAGVIKIIINAKTFPYEIVSGWGWEELQCDKKLSDNWAKKVDTMKFH